MVKRLTIWGIGPLSFNLKRDYKRKHLPTSIDLTSRAKFRIQFEFNHRNLFAAVIDVRLI